MLTFIKERMTEMGNPLSEQIAEIIEKMIEENGGELELKRNKLACDIGCVPSQINYVITSRFNTNRGYMVESRRGGGGFVKITKISFDTRDAHLMHTLAAIGEGIDLMSARAVLINLFDNGIISAKELKYIYACVTDSSIAICPVPLRDTLRASILKSVILAIKNERNQ